VISPFVAGSNPTRLPQTGFINERLLEGKLVLT